MLIWNVSTASFSGMNCVSFFYFVFMRKWQHTGMYFICVRPVFYILHHEQDGIKKKNPKNPKQTLISLNIHWSTWLYVTFPELWLQTTTSFGNLSTHLTADQSNHSMKFSSTVTTCLDLSHTRRDSYQTAGGCMLDATSLDFITTKHYHFVQLHQEVGEQNDFLSFLFWRQWGRGHV